MTSPIGHEASISALLEAVRSGRPHHGWILAGARGIGKAGVARAVAMRLLAEAAGPPPPGSSIDVPQDHPIRRLIEAGAHPDYADLSLLEKESGLARNIGIDQIRGLQRLLQSAPSLSARRIVVIDSADDLERPAANALLKSLEEPPPGMLFLLISHVPGRLLPTIRSRCRFLRLDPLSDPQVRDVLRLAGAGLDAAEIEALVRIAGGSPGRALRYAGLSLAEMERALEAIAADGDPDNRNRVALARQLAQRAARPRYEAFLERVPSFIADAATRRSGLALGSAIDHWEAARQLAAGALVLSLDPAAVVFELGSHIAALAPSAA
ncbi:MAG: DNA polymerase III subunit delta' [Sphingobium sp.]